MSAACEDVVGSVISSVGAGAALGSPKWLNSLHQVLKVVKLKDTFSWRIGWVSTICFGKPVVVAVCSWEMKLVE